jgi:leader peptidase (prepilin peptidase)/N-methyltransferase
MYVFAFLLFVLGASVGSFLNVCIYRMPRGESVVAPPSHCPKCNTRLQAADLVPLLSQVLLRARCRYCGARISWRYFGIEFLTGVLWALVALWAGPFGIDPSTSQWTGNWLLLAQGLIFVSCLVVVFWVDYDTRLIQLEAVFLMGLAGVAHEAWRVTQGEAMLTTGGFWADMHILPSPLPGSLWAMIVTSSALWFLRELFSWIYGKEALGFGDVMLVGAIAANLGWSIVIWTFFFLSVVGGATVGIAVKIPAAIHAYNWARQRGQKYLDAGRGEYWQQQARPLALHAFRKTIPFGPMLAVGAILAMLYGTQINQKYLDWVQSMEPAPQTTTLSAPATGSAFQAPGVQDSGGQDPGIPLPPPEDLGSIRRRQ